MECNKQSGILKVFPEFHPKEWGEEIWIANNEIYCGKVLIFRNHANTSYHFHRKKDETFYVQFGRLEIVINGVETMLHSGQALRVRAGTKHQARLSSGEIEARVIEISTPHKEEDVIRIDREWHGGKSDG